LNVTILNINDSVSSWSFNSKVTIVGPSGRGTTGIGVTGERGPTGLGVTGQKGSTGLGVTGQKGSTGLTGPIGPLVTGIMSTAQGPPGLDPGATGEYFISSSNYDLFSADQFIIIVDSTNKTSYFQIKEVTDIQPINERIKVIIENIGQEPATWNLGDKTAIVGPKRYYR